MTSLRLAVLNLWRRKVPSVIAVCAIAVSVACSGILLRLNQVSERRFSTLGKGGDAIVGAKAGGIEILLGALNGEGDYPGFLPMNLFNTLRAQQSVKFEDGAQSDPNYIRSVIPFLFFAKAGDLRVVGTDDSFLKRPVAEDSPEMHDGHWAYANGELVAGSQAASHLGVKIGDDIEIKPWTGDNGPNALHLKLAGVLAPMGSAFDRMLFSNLETAQTVLKTQNLAQQSIWQANVLNYFLVYLKPGGFSGLSTLINRRTVGQAVLVDQEVYRLRLLTGTGRKLGLFVTILVLALGGLSVTAMLITRFEAMSLQLAVLRALGYQKKAIGRWLLWEGFLLGIASCLLGAVLDWIGFPIMRGLLGEALPPPDLIHSYLWESYPVWITAIAATTASVFIPLYRVYHQDVHFSLRS